MLPEEAKHTDDLQALNPVERYRIEFGDYCAATVWSRRQKFVAGFFVFTLILCFILWPFITALICIAVLCVASLGIVSLRLLAYAVGLAPLDKTHYEKFEESDKNLPVYSVLVPLYNEPAIVGTLINSLRQLDYPHEKLDIQLLLEEHDSVTRDEIAQHELPDFISCCVVEAGKPQTKPRACDYGLDRARGEYVVIFDAEDRPEPDQLRKSVARFAQSPKNVVCLQARLSHFNTRESLAARWTDLDYFLWYRLAMLGLQRMGLPMPLGGTSNHFRMAALKQLGGWDPFNVTEDCDLGLRIARNKWKTRMLDSVTWEEAVTRYPSWIKQRSRWIKGFLQSALVHTRRDAFSELGPIKYMSMLALVPGSVLVQLLAPLVFLSPIFAIIQISEMQYALKYEFLPIWQEGAFFVALQSDIGFSLLLFMSGVLGVCIGLLVLFSQLLFTVLFVRRDLLPAALSAPIAWCFLFVAAWRAVAELFIVPFYWAKTEHGKSGSQHSFVRFCFNKIAFFGLFMLATYGLATLLLQVDHVAHTWFHQEFSSYKQKASRFHSVDYPQLRLEPIESSILKPQAKRAKPIISDNFATVKVSLEDIPAADMWAIDSRLLSLHQECIGIRAVAFLERDMPENMRLQWEIRIHDDYWYSLLDDQPLIPGRWTSMELDLRPGKEEFVAKGHGRVWDTYAQGAIEEIRLVSYQSPGLDPADPYLRIGKVEALLDDAEFEQLESGKRNIQLVTVQNPKMGKIIPAVGDGLTQAQTHQVIQWDLEIDKRYTNPYDPALVELNARITHKQSGKIYNHPLFFMTPFSRENVKSHEELKPAGSSHWSLRWAAPIAGTYSAKVFLQEYGKEIAQIEIPDFEITTGDHPGYIQRHAEKPYFHHQNGDFFYPIGHNVCWPVDTRQAYPYKFSMPTDTGTYIYDTIFPKMAAHGENWARIWMSYPWLGLENLESWRHFDGLGKYNQAHAARLDHLLDLAQQNGLYIRLTMQHYSDSSMRWGNTNWLMNAYNVEHGGPLKIPGQVFTDEYARTLQKNRLRYIIARWGAHPHVESWELWGEVNLVRGFNHNIAVPWHKEMISWIKGLDSTQRPIFTHCHNWQLGMGLWGITGLDCVQGNGYIRPPNHTVNHIVNFRRYLKEVERFQKPVFVAEYGGRSERGAPDSDYLEAQLHSGLWSSITYPFAGVAFSWWWTWIEGADMYKHYKALPVFLEGINRIERNLESRRVRVSWKKGALAAHGMQDAEGGIYWVHHPGIFQTMKVPEVSGAQLHLVDLEPGEYRLRMLNTMETSWNFDQIIQVGVEGEYSLDLPNIYRDLAIRLDRVALN